MDIKIEGETLNNILLVFDKITPTHMFFVISITALFVALTAVKSKK